MAGIRSAEADELEGLDMPEMGAHAYPELLELSVPPPGSLLPAST